MRIIAGSARGRQVATLAGEDTRPTLERVKEGMFSAVQFWLPGAKVLDLFAGSGQLGLEALSRGAKQCVFVDSAHDSTTLITKNIKALQFEGNSQVVCKSADAFLLHTTATFDLIIADPPYGQDMLQRLLPKLGKVCTQGSIVLFESEYGLQLPDTCEDLKLEKTYRYGNVMLWRYIF